MLKRPETVDDIYENAVKQREYGVALSLAMEQARLNGYRTFAYHGTYNKFDEFKEGDVGFHFSRDLVCAQNRLDDLYDASADKVPVIHHVALYIHNPIVIDCDLGSWTARDIYGMAHMHVTGIPFESPVAMYLYEQRKLAKSAYRLLNSVGVDDSAILKIQKDIHDDPSLNSIYTDELHGAFRDSKYDGVVYRNDFEAFEGDDPICYIVFSPNQVKTIYPVYDDENKLVQLSTRFDRHSNKFTH